MKVAKNIVSMIYTWFFINKETGYFTLIKAGFISNILEILIIILSLISESINLYFNKDRINTRLSNAGFTTLIDEGSFRNLFILTGLCIFILILSILSHKANIYLEKRFSDSTNLSSFIFSRICIGINYYSMQYILEFIRPQGQYEYNIDKFIVSPYICGSPTSYKSNIALILLQSIMFVWNFGLSCYFQTVSFSVGLLDYLRHCFAVSFKFKSAMHENVNPSISSLNNSSYFLNNIELLRKINELCKSFHVDLNTIKITNLNQTNIDVIYLWNNTFQIHYGAIKYFSDDELCALLANKMSLAASFVQRIFKFIIIFDYIIMFVLLSVLFNKIVANSARSERNINQMNLPGYFQENQESRRNIFSHLNAITNVLNENILEERLDQEPADVEQHPNIIEQDFDVNTLNENAGQNNVLNNRRFIQNVSMNNFIKALKDIFPCSEIFEAFGLFQIARFFTFLIILKLNRISRLNQMNADLSIARLGLKDSFLSVLMKMSEKYQNQTYYGMSIGIFSSSLSYLDRYERIVGL